MFYIVYTVPDNVVVCWHAMSNVGVPYPTVEEYKSSYAHNSGCDPNTVNVIQLEDSQAPELRPASRAMLIDPATLQFSPNPNYVPPAPVEPPAE
jgi:hypothetical protein